MLPRQCHTESTGLSSKPVLGTTDTGTSTPGSGGAVCSRCHHGFTQSPDDFYRFFKPDQKKSCRTKVGLVTQSLGAGSAERQGWLMAGRSLCCNESDAGKRLPEGQHGAGCHLCQQCWGQAGAGRASLLHGCERPVRGCGAAAGIPAFALLG